jgi:hypothetical protein
MKRIAKYAILALLLAASQPAAKAVLLTDLLQSGATLQQGDKIFGNFGWAGSTAGVEIFGITDAGLYGIRIDGIQLTGPGTASFGLTYSVQTAPGSGMLISDIHQKVGLGGFGAASTLVTENAYDSLLPGSTLLATSTVGGWHDDVDPPGELTDILELAVPRQFLWITKQITLTVDSGASRRLAIKQTFSQTAVPDGGTTLMLLGVALSGIGVFTRKLKK